MYQFWIRNIYSGKQLQIMKLTEDRSCPKCKTEDEDLIHMFWSCKHVQAL